MFIRLLLPIFLLVPLYSCADDTQNSSKLETLEQKASYAFGVNLATRIKASEVTFDATALSQGIEDSLNGKTLRLSDDEMKASHAEFINQAKAKIEQQQMAKANAAQEEGDRFLAENTKKEGVVTTESGLQYKVITPGTGASPTDTDTVVTHYRGTLIDGREFDSSYSRNKPATFPVKGVIKGWTEALQLMKVGAKWQLFIPSNLAYGATKRSELILPNTALVFEIELLEIK